MFLQNPLTRAAFDVYKRKKARDELGKEPFFGFPEVKKMVRRNEGMKEGRKSFVSKEVAKSRKWQSGSQNYTFTGPTLRELAFRIKLRHSE